MSGRNNLRAFTLLEMLIAAAIVAVIVGAAAPLAFDALGPDDREFEGLRNLARATRAEALGAGESRRILIHAESLDVVGGGQFRLPPGWRFEVRRAGESRFRAPAKIEAWQFTGDGLCEPLALRAVGPESDREFDFDPLTALEPPRVQ